MNFLCFILKYILVLKVPSNCTFFFALAQSLFALKLYRMYAILSCYHQTKVQLVITSRSKNTWLIKYVWNQINVTFWASYIHSHV